MPAFCRAESADPAGRCARPAPGVNSGAGDAVVAARHDARGFHAHGTGQGADPRPGDPPACLAQRADPGVDDHRLQFSFLLAGAIIIENVFFLPGLGRLVFQGIIQRDLIVVKSVVLLLVAAVVIVTLLVDLAYAAADPRLRTRGR